MFPQRLVYASSLILTALVVTAAFAFEVTETIVMEPPEDDSRQNSWIGPVEFPHGFHALQVSCQECHHEGTDTGFGEYILCRDCHMDQDPTEPLGFYRAWHSPGPPSCLGCHTQGRAEGGKHPVGCTSACHKPIQP